MLRRKGYSINKLSIIFGRSTSVVQRILKKNNLSGKQLFGSAFEMRHILNRFDMRKSEAPVKILSSINGLFNSKRMVEIFQKWLEFMSGEGEKPP